MRFSVRILPFVFTFLILIAGSCRKDPSWDISVKTPLFKSDLGIEDLVTDSIIQINPDSSISIVFNYELFALTADSIIDIPDSLYYLHFIIPIGLQPPPGTLVMEQTQSKYYNMGGAQLIEMKIKSGYMVIRAYNYVGDDAFIEFSLDNSLINGNPAMVSGLIPSYPNTGQYLYQKFDISGMYLDLRGSYLNCNALTSTMKIYANPYATSPVVINYGDSIDILVEFQDIVLDYAKGYFSQYEFDEDDITDFDIFDNLSIDAIDLENVDMTVEIINSIGADASFQLKHLEGYGQNTVALNSSWVGKTINITRAVESPPGSGTVVPSTLTLDFNGGNVEEFIENLPSSLSYGMKGKINPFGNISSGNDFVYSGKGFKAMARMEFPLNIALSNLTLRDTVEYDIARGDSYIHESMLYLDVSNGFPISLSFRIDLLNEANSVIDSIKPNSDIQSAPVDGNGKVIAPLISHIEIYLDETKTKHLYEAKKAVITAIVNTGTSGQKVKFYSNYRLTFSFSGLFDYHFDS